MGDSIVKFSGGISREELDKKEKELRAKYRARKLKRDELYLKKLNQTKGQSFFDLIPKNFSFLSFFSRDANLFEKTTVVESELLVSDDTPISLADVEPIVGNSESTSVEENLGIDFKSGVKGFQFKAENRASKRVFYGSILGVGILLIGGFSTGFYDSLSSGGDVSSEQITPSVDSGISSDGGSSIVKNQKYDDLLVKYSSLLKQYDILKAQNNVLGKDNASLVRDVAQYAKKIDEDSRSYLSDIGTLELTNAELFSKIGVLEKNLIDLAQNNGEDGSVIGDLETQLGQLKTKFSKINQKLKRATNYMVLLRGGKLHEYSNLDLDDDGKIDFGEKIVAVYGEKMFKIGNFGVIAGEFPALSSQKHDLTVGEFAQNIFAICNPDDLGARSVSDFDGVTEILKDKFGQKYYSFETVLLECGKTKFKSPN